MSEVIDLDIIVPENKVVRLGGVEYVVPGDMPMEIFLRLNNVESIKDEDGQDDQVAQIKALVDVISDLLTWEQEGRVDPAALEQVKESVRQVIRSRGTRFTFTLMRNIYKPEDEAADAAAAAKAEGGDAPLDQAQPAAA